MNGKEHQEKVRFAQAYGPGAPYGLAGPQGPALPQPYTGPVRGDHGIMASNQDLIIQADYQTKKAQTRLPYASTF